MTQTIDNITTRITPDEDNTQWETVEVSLLVATPDTDRIPLTPEDDDVAWDEIAQEVLQAAFAKAHDLIHQHTDLKYSGDLMPGEQFALERLAHLIVRSVLVNGPLAERQV